MKVSQNFGLLYCLLLIIQAMLSNFCQFGPYVMISILPAMVLCIPLGVGTIGCMSLAFASGLCIDWLSEGLIGLNAAALLPVALLRKPVIRVFLGEDMISRRDYLSFKKNGTIKISAALLSVLVIYMGVYVFLDGAGTRPLWFSLTKSAASTACSFVFSLIVMRQMIPDSKRQEGLR